MKRISVVIMIMLFAVLSAIKSRAQENKPFSITPYDLEVTYSKTISLVFPYAIKSVDRGSSELLAQKAGSVENILLVKAAHKGIGQTNLTVVTEDGSIYECIVDYSDEPRNLSVVFGRSQTGQHNMAVFEKDATTDEIARMAKAIADKKRINNGLFDRTNDIIADVWGIYIHNDVLYLQLFLQNNSALGYSLQSCRFFVRDRNRVKRTAYQETEITPLYSYGDISSIGAASQHIVTFALPKFTIPDKKDFKVEIMEKNGGRNLSFRIKNKELIHAKPI